MVGGRFVHRRRSRQRSAAPPELDDAGIAGGRHAARSEIRAHEERVVIDPGGARLCLGIVNPPATNCLVVKSNSRRSVASDPPRDRATMQRRYSGSKQLAPLHDQGAPSALLNESRSITVSHDGFAVA